MRRYQIGKLPLPLISQCAEACRKLLKQMTKHFGVLYFKESSGRKGSFQTGLPECIIQILRSLLQWTSTFAANCCVQVKIKWAKHHHYQANDRHRDSLFAEAYIDFTYALQWKCILFTLFTLRLEKASAVNEWAVCLLIVACHSSAHCWPLGWHVA